ncbi:MAG: peptidoglycan DD-metalloendopeptidase family protein [Muribaculaceae bacterium]|nr:peptidoglycan DD-metalloendopeptidase family protein [Muribaculaceae bacterium]
MKKIIQIVIILALGLMASGAQAKDSFDFDGVLAGMNSGGIDFDSMLSAMEGAPSAGKGQRAQNGDGGYALLASVADAMSVNNALDFITNAYAGNGYQGGLKGTYSNYSGGTRDRRDYSHLVPGSAVLPIHGFVTSGYGYRPKFGRMHRGVDISLHTGDTVRAAIDGVVLRVSNDPRGYGLFVCIRHDNGLETRYAHLSRTLAIAGERIYAGDPVGLGGSTGNSTGPHLHFETRVQGEAVDPTTMFDFSMPGGRHPYRTLAELDDSNPAYRQASMKTGLANTIGTGINRSTYVVRPGDTIGSVARKHGMSVLTLCRLNMLSSSDALQPGRMLKLR